MTTAEVSQNTGADDKAALDNSGSRRFPVVLAGFQTRAVQALAEAIAVTQTHIAHDQDRRAIIGRARGTCLLAAPTGSGKTLMIGRTLQTLTPEPIIPAMGFRGSVWFWFTPYSGLVEQTKLALRGDCDGLRARDLFQDRDPDSTRDGDVFVHTWAAVAANNRETRRLRRSNEKALSIDDMIASLREQKWFVGAVIDEAHLNFGMGAKAAASFFLEHLRPDVAILATATPRDAKLQAFCDAADIKQITKVEVARDDVVKEGLNKRGLVAAHLVLDERQRLAIDPNEAILRAAVIHHRKVKTRLADLGIPLVPLLMIQVADVSDAEKDPAGKAKRTLVEYCGMNEESVVIHTSGDPDPAFHSLANDEGVEALVFKLSAATGFDAPRAWSLVSLRSSISPDFGLQVVGRIMRVHRLVRPIHGQDPLLDRGTVFIVDRDRQGGLEAAASQLKALRSSIQPVADQLSIIEVATTDKGNPTQIGADFSVLIQKTSTKDARKDTSDLTLRSALDIAKAVSEAAMAKQPDLPGFFDPLGADAEKQQAATKLGQVVYHLRRDLGIPECLQRERMPTHEQLPQLAFEAAGAFKIDNSVIALLLQPGIDVELRLRELLLSEGEKSERIRVRPSAAKLAEAAQLAFRFSDDIDPRLFRKHLVDRFRKHIEAAGGFNIADVEIRRVIDQIAVYQRERIEDAMREAMGKYIRLEQGDPISEWMPDVDGLFSANKAAFGVFPSRLNGPEKRFAEFIDELPGVRWWMRNPDHPRCTWSVRIVLSNGRSFFPDFVVGVAGRKTPDGVRLVEIKDDGETGRLHADLNYLKILDRHRSYLDVLWVAEGDGDGSTAFHRLSFSKEKGRILMLDQVNVDNLRLD